MTYEELKAKLFEKQKENLNLTKRIQSIENDLSQIEVQRSEIEVKMSRALEEARVRQKQTFIANHISKWELELGKVNKEISDLNASYKAELQECDEESIYRSLKQQDGVTPEIGESMEELKSLVVEDLGERFYNEYFNQINTRQIKMNPKVLGRLFRRFGSLKAKVSKASTSRDFSVFDRISDYIGNLAKSNLAEKPKGVLIFAGTATLGMVAISWIAFPAYIVFLSLDFALRVKKSSLYSRAIKEYKIVSDNLDRIDEILRKRAREEKDRMVREIEESYQNSLKELNERKLELSRTLESERKSADSSFVFDDSDLKRTYTISLGELDSRKQRLSAELSQLKESLETTSREIQEIREHLKSEVDNIKLKYLNFDKVGNSLLYDNEFLIDVKGDKPVMFVHDRSSCLFFYKELKDVPRFIRLICAQLRCRLNPFSLRIQVWDKEFMGIWFGSFYKEQLDLFNIYTSKEDIDSALGNLSDQLVKRSEVILKEHKDIEEYNKYMISIESLTEFYNFIFIINPDKELFSDYKFSQLLSIGPSVGIYTMLFLNVDSIEKEIKPIVRKIGRFYMFDGGTISKKAEQYVLEELVKFDD
jgi:hypothetical protein